MNACPICGKPVDALRARNVKVRGIQVVAYCSPECLAQAADSAGVPAPKQVAPESGPVIEISYEPVSGVVTSAKDERTPTPELIKLDDKKKSDKKADKKSDKKADKKAEAKKPDDKKPDVVDDKSEPRPVFKILEEAGGTARSVTPPKGALIQPALLDNRSTSAEKVSPAKLSDAAPGKRRLTRETLERDNKNVDQAEDWLADEPANVHGVRSGTEVEGAVRGGGGKRALLILVLIAIIGAGVVLAVKFLGGRSDAVKQGTGTIGSATSSQPDATEAGSARATRVVGPSQPIEAVEPDDKRPPLARATEVLKHWLAAKDSPRVQRLAAAALSRTGDGDAIERLALALQKDTLEDAGRHDVAYALARAKDKRGLDAMTAAIAAPRRDDKLTVGRLLVQLGDTRAVTALTPYLELPQHKLGAAEWLARLAEPRAIKALEQIRADEKATPDDKARTAIALTLAGKPGFGDELHALLKDPRWNWFAAEALATKRDDAARPVLVKLLEVTSLRVGAARSLRALAPERTHDAELKTLITALDHPDKQKDTEQLTIAEAILLLSGPPAWAEHQ